MATRYYKVSGTKKIIILSLVSYVFVGRAFLFALFSNILYSAFECSFFEKHKNFNMNFLNEISNLDDLTNNQKFFLNYLIQKNFLYLHTEQTYNKENTNFFLENMKKGWPFDTNLIYTNFIFNFENHRKKISIYSGFTICDNQIFPVTFFKKQGKAFDPIACLFNKKPELYLGCKINRDDVFYFLLTPLSDNTFLSPGELYFSNMKL